MKFLKEIIKAIRDGKKLPSLFELIGEYGRWNRLKENRDVFHNAIPWMAFWAIDFLDQAITPEMCVFEYGGGGSTLFFASRVKELVTIEHNQEWFAGLQKEMEKNTMKKWTGLFIEPEDALPAVAMDASNPGDYFSSDPNFAKKTFRKYASAIDQYPDEHFDVILVDGRVRPSCLVHSLKKVKRNGLLVLDNADRPHYLEKVKSRLSDYELLHENFGPTPYASWFTQANIWRRIR